MATTTNVNQIKLNVMTQEQYNAATKSPTELYMVTDADSDGQIIQVSTLPTADATEEGKIYQYVGATDSTYTNAYFYKCVSDGQSTPTYSWTAVQVQAGGGLPSQAGNTGKFLTTDGTNASWGDALINNYPSNNNTVIGNNATLNSSSIESSVVLGANAKSRDHYGVAIGRTADAGYLGTSVGRESYSATCSIAIGAGARATGAHAIQLSAYIAGAQATNSDANTFKVANNNGNYELMSADGTIPEARLADTTNAAQGQALVLDSNLNAVWTNVDTLPSQTGNSGKFLTTNGTTASWGEISAYTANEVEAIWNNITPTNA